MQEQLILLEELGRQEEALQFERFSNEDALALGLRLVEYARRNGKAVTVDIARNGHQLFHHAMAGTTPDNAGWVRRKNNVVQRFGHSSYYMGTQYRSKGKTFEEHSGLDFSEYAAHGGAFPLLIKGTGPVGTITVSGLPQREDHELLVTVLREFLAVDHHQ
ncbi:heme-degrading domain-containing protein [Pseudoduganella sp. LjRoot289]|uniref:heme-degrading domain-containing protein n=1 Tax=Pseudoduganella sp. LjRoot289 TaxID=3342314 RepID=UPI003ECDA0B3